MKKLFFIVSVAVAVSGPGCNRSLKQKTFHKAITSPSKVLRVIDGGRTDCSLVFENEHHIDTIPFLRYKRFSRQIDAVTTFAKKPESYVLLFRNLTGEDGEQYDTAFNLLYW